MMAPTHKAEATSTSPQGSARLRHGFTCGIVEAPTPGEGEFHQGCGGYLARGGRGAGRKCVECGATVESRVFVRSEDGRAGWQTRRAFLRGRP